MNPFRRFVVVLIVGCTGALGAQNALAAGPALSVTPDSFPSGQVVTVAGNGFAPNADVIVWFDENGDGALGLASPFGATNERSTPAHADSTGSFSVPLTAMFSPLGSVLHFTDGARNFKIRAGAAPTASPQLAETDITLTTCWFQECMLNGALVVCILGHSPSDLISDCKTLDSSYTDPTGVYDFTDFGPTFAGAGVLAAAVNSLNPLFLPGPGCAQMEVAIQLAEHAPYGNSVPGKEDFFKPWTGLRNIACGLPFGPVPPFGFEVNGYVLAASAQSVLDGRPQPDPALADAHIIQLLVLAVQGAAGAADAVATLTGIPPGTIYTTVVLAAQHVFATAAVGGALACGFVNYYCNGSDITANIMHQNVQQMLPMPVPGLNMRWGDLIGWSLPRCTDNTLPARDPTTHKYLDSTCEDAVHKTIPGSAGPDNIFGPDRCLTGFVVGRSIGYDGDISFDVSDGTLYPPGATDPYTGLPYPAGTRDPTTGTVATLTNYHNYESGEGGSPAPGGIDVEVPITDRARFPLASVLLGTRVTVCGHWVADMAESWNELHPIRSLTILPPDTTPPVITRHVSGTLGNNGWYTSNVDVSWTVSDPETPVSSSSGCAATTIGIDTSTAGQALTCTATSSGGTASDSVTIKRDATPPIIGHQLSSPPDGSNGWYVSPPTVTFTCADPTSGLASCLVDGTSGTTITLGESSSPQAVAGTALDNAGNESHSSTPGLLVDLSDPSVSAATDRQANASGWFNAAVTVTFTCSDTISGVAFCTDPVTVREGGAQSATGTTTDFAGRLGGVTLTPINVDTTAPLVRYTGNAGTYTVDQMVNITCGASDALSGVSSSTCANISGPAYAFGLGTTNGSAAATDLAGNTGIGSTSFVVIVTPASLAALITRFFGGDQHGANGLIAKANSIANAPNSHAKSGALGAFENQVDAKTGKPLTAAQAVLLKQLAAAL